jgi:hypothetical protein
VGYRTFGNKCELLVYSNRTVHLSYEFYEGRKEIPFEPEGKEWLADVLLDVVRSTGIDAEGLTTRVNSIDYLLKPISYDDLFRSMNKLSSLRENLITGTQRLELEELAKVLDPEQFFRINRTFALHINGIKDVIIHSNSHLIRSLLSAGRR